MGDIAWIFPYLKDKAQYVLEPFINYIRAPNKTESHIKKMRNIKNGMSNLMSYAVST